MQAPNGPPHISDRFFSASLKARHINSLLGFIFTFLLYHLLSKIKRPTINAQIISLKLSNTARKSGDTHLICSKESGEEGIRYVSPELPLYQWILSPGDTSNRTPLPPMGWLETVQELLIFRGVPHAAGLHEHRASLKTGS